MINITLIIMVMKREMINMMMVITTKKITGVNSRINLVHLPFTIPSSNFWTSCCKSFNRLFLFFVMVLWFSIEVHLFLREKRTFTIFTSNRNSHRHSWSPSSIHSPRYCNRNYLMSYLFHKFSIISFPSDEFFSTESWIPIANKYNSIL